ncbi:MAG: D-tyrosyl-tRNA(Tyr) deacylase [Bacteroidia bacterium]|nr:D-tyrosyl-tRNA(Tyr) deacylase [Bacteroidia bacterium]
MRAVIQRVKLASVEIDGMQHAAIGSGLLVLLGITQQDTAEDAEWLVSKILQMRIFSDHEGKMNLSVQDISGEILVVSQFTLFAQVKKGNRPSFIQAAKPEHAIPLYELFIEKCGSTGLKVKSGQFGADMQVKLANDGPVTICIDTQRKE